MQSIIRPILWLALVSIAALLLIVRINSGVTISSDILDALPSDESDSHIIELAKKIAEQHSRKLVFLLGTKELEDTISAATWLRQALASIDGIAATESGIGEEQSKAIFTFLQEHPWLNFD
ncbi:MAG: hypothetical protein KDD62_10050, partial [Bdellovibrionales bacterium]|nr:hypothetical protein [Bdellovibrionales bacterium]